MSLTSQLKEKDSPVTMFFKENEDRPSLSRFKRMLGSRMQGEENTNFKPPSFVLGYLGTTVDYLIRYVVGGNSLDFDSTIAKKAVSFSSYQNSKIIKNLYKLATEHLNGADARTSGAIYGATALTILDTYYRTMMLPSGMDSDFKLGSDKKYSFINKLKVSLDSYYSDVIGGARYEREVGKIIDLFICNYTNTSGALFGAKFMVLNGIPGNAGFVGGADFDCIIDMHGHSILTELKTKKSNISLQHVRQLLGYALLCEKKSDGYFFNSLGVYHCKTGEFYYSQCEDMINAVFPRLGDLASAQKAFIKYLRQYYR